ncbi:cytochrome c maturation protein CcmE [Pelagibacteraceae bacterium]|nr:cytochrome c maturation protein CcmE [Pelagibacteraceae bacterium]MDC0060154.1 cytochrome c maturation protein CcmE [Pelagibacteraceae bacterium]
MSLRFQRLILILLTLIMLCTALLLMLFNTKQNIVFFYTPTELLENNITSDKKIRIGGYVKKLSFVEKSLNNYEFKVTDNTNDLVIFYEGMLPDLFREEQGIVIEGFINENNNIIASKVYAKHDENYMPASIKKELEKNNQWQKDYK